MYRRVRDLLIDSYSLLNFEQFQHLVNKLFQNNYVEPSSIVLSLIVRKSYHDNGPLQAFETIKNLLIQWNNLVGMFPIIRKLLRDDCTEELKQVKIEISTAFICFFKVRLIRARSTLDEYLNQRIILLAIAGSVHSPR